MQNRDQLQPLIEAVIRTRPANEWTSLLRAAGVPCGVVRSIDEVLSDPQIIARALVDEVEHPAIGRISVLGLPIKLSDSPGAIRLPPPRLGEHSRKVLGNDLQISEERIQTLVDSGVLAATSLRD